MRMEVPKQNLVKWEHHKQKESVHRTFLSIAAQVEDLIMSHNFFKRT